MAGSKQSELRKIVSAVYRDVLVNKYKDQHFWILVAFIPTFIVARLLVKTDPRIFLNINGNHVHHFAFGFIILALAGYLSIVGRGKSPPWLAFLFGIGLALSVDEAGMWLHLTNQYYNETSENALIVVTAILVGLVYFKDFWIRLIKDIFVSFTKLH